MSSSCSFELPPPSANQAYCDVSALEGGHVRLPKHMYVAGAEDTENDVCPSLAFFIKNASTGEEVVFDLGLGKDTSKYPELARAKLESLHPVWIPQDVRDSLEKGGISGESALNIIISHLHFDHVGDPDLFPNATFIMAEACKSLLEATGPDAPPIAKFSSQNVPLAQSKFLPDADFNVQIGPWRCFDYFKDGSLYIVDSPGHLPGHINVLARTSADGSWIFLAADTAHRLCLIAGCGDVCAEYVNPDTGKVQSAHVDLPTAQLHIDRVADLRRNPKVFVLLAHDDEWYAENKEGPAFFPGKIPAKRA